MCKILCFLIAAGNLLTMTLTVYKIMQHTDEEPMLEVLISPCLANMVLAVLLIIGVVTKEISLVRLFKWFFYAQLVFALLMVVYGHRYFDSVKRPAMIKVCFTIMFVVCGIELTIVSATIDDMRRKQNAAEGLVVFMPAVRTV